MSPRRRPPDDAGFTLIELLVAMSISTIVLLATLMAFDVFSTATAQESRVTDANDQIRQTVDDMTDRLRGATALVRALPNDLVFSRKDTATATRTERMCMGQNGGIYRYQSTSKSDPQADCSTPEAGWVGGRVSSFSSPSPSTDTLFTYDGAAQSASPSTVRAVGLTVRLDSRSGSRTTSNVLRTGAVIRQTASTLALDEGDVTVVCTAAGPQLQLGVTVPGDLGGSLAVTYSADGSIISGTGPLGTATLATNVTAVVATITDALGVTKSIRKVVACAP